MADEERLERRCLLRRQVPHGLAGLRLTVGLARDELLVLLAATVVRSQIESELEPTVAALTLPGGTASASVER